MVNPTDGESDLKVSSDGDPTIGISNWWLVAAGFHGYLYLGKSTNTVPRELQKNIVALAGTSSSNTSPQIGPELIVRGG